MKLHFKRYFIPLFVLLLLLNATSIFSAVCDNTANAVEFVQPTGAHNCYNIGDLVIYQDHIYESLLNANVWAPSAYPAGWSDCGSNEIPDNTLPTDISLSSTTINDDAGTNAQVGVLSAVDNEGGVMTYRFIAGIGDENNSSFLIFNNILKAKESFHYATKSSYNIRIEVEDEGGLKYSEHFVITVNQPEKPDELIYVTHLPSGISNFALYSHNDMDIKQQVEIKGGSVGANANIFLGEDLNSGYATTVIGDVWANGNILVDYFTQVDGDVTAGGNITQKLASVVTGDVNEDSKIPYFEIPTKTVNESGVDLEVYYDETRILQPGNYGDVVAKDRSVILLNAGIYNFKSFDIVGHDSKMIINIAKGETVEINVKNNLAFGFRFKMEFTGETQPYAVKIYTDQTEKFILTVDSEFYGIFTAPNAEVDIQRRVKVFGAVYADKINVLWNASVCKPPVLSDIWHSGWAYAPPFDGNTISYKAIVSELIYAIKVSAKTEVEGATISVNGGAIGTSVDLDEDPKNIHILLTGGECNVNTNYTLSAKNSGDFKIFVNDNSPADVSDCDGKTWETAYKDLQLALNNAMVSGKEIWVAEGTYKPSRKVDDNDPRSATFMLLQGTELIGGFNGTEAEQKPKGSAYNTILSGDLASDDKDNISWPPTEENEQQYIDDNVYHVVTINGKHKAKSIRIKGFTITGGVANGFNSESRGGGVSSEEAYPAIEQCIIKNNYATSHGAGIYGGSGLQSFSKALFKDNYSLSGFGAGMYVSEAENLELSRVVFDGNIAAGVNSNAFGGAIFSNKSNLSFVNSIFYNNSANKTGGMIYGIDSKFSFKYVTATENFSSKGNGGISLVGTSNADFVNSILWNNDGETEGNNIKITYSCISGGYTGTGNISTDPKFAGSGAGLDNRWGTFDDELKLTSGSSCFDIGLATIEEIIDDIGYTMRPLNDGYDMGAYEIPKLSDGDSDVDLGLLTLDNTFINKGFGEIYLSGVSRKDLYKRIYSSSATTIRVLLGKTADFEGISEGDLYVTVKDESGNVINPGNIKMRFYRNGSTQSHYVYTTQKVENNTFAKGEPIFMVDKSTYQTLNNNGEIKETDPFTILPVTEDCNITIHIPAGQFY